MEDAGSLAEIFLQQSPACQWLVSTDGVFARVYGDPQTLFGRTTAQLLGRVPADVLGPDEATVWRGRFTRALNGEMLRLRERRANGTWYVSVFPLRIEGETQFAGGIAREITPWSAAEQELRHTVLGALKAQEFERAMVSKFLHDSVGQNLTALGLQLDLIRMDLESISPETCGRIGDIQKLLEEMMESVREYSYELNPSTVERAGLRPALDRLVFQDAGAFFGLAAGECGSVFEAGSETGKRAIPDSAGGRGECRATFRLLRDRNRGKVHTCRHAVGSAR